MRCQQVVVTRRFKSTQKHTNAARLLDTFKGISDVLDPSGYTPFQPDSVSWTSPYNSLLQSLTRTDTTVQHAFADLLDVLESSTKVPFGGVSGLSNITRGRSKASGGPNLVTCTSCTNAPPTAVFSNGIHTRSLHASMGAVRLPPFWASLTDLDLNFHYAATHAPAMYLDFL